MLTEEQIASLRPKWNDYPERRVVVPVYPEARKKRGLKKDEQAQVTEDLGALPAGGLTGAPNVRHWGLFLQSSTGGSTYFQRGSQRFLGPALIHSFTGYIAIHQPFGTVDPIQITINNAPIGDLNSGALQRPPGSPLGETSSVVWANAVVPVSSPTGFLTNDNFQGGSRVIPIGVYTTIPEFYLGMSMFARNATSIAINGTFRIIENAPPESVGWV